MKAKLGKYECRYEEKKFLHVKFTGVSLCFMYSTKDFCLNDRSIPPKGSWLLKKMLMRSAGQAEEVPPSQQVYGEIHLSIKNT